MLGKIKELKFNKKKPLDLSNDAEVGCDVITCDKSVFTMRDFRKQSGHDDSLPYTALLCHNGKAICRCTNDGWGGETQITPVGTAERAILTSIELSLKKYKWQYGKTIFDLKIDFIADTLANTCYYNSLRTIKGRL